MQNNHYDLETLKAHIQEKGKGFIKVAHRNVDGYPGMVQVIMIRFDTKKEEYLLDLEWASFGLDLFGDTLMENYMYGFESIDRLLEYLFTKYAIKVTDVPIKYQFDGNQFPNPIYHKDREQEFEATWKKFQEDFKNGIFLEDSLKLVYVRT